MNVRSPMSLYPGQTRERDSSQVYQGIKDHINLDLVKCVLMAGPGFVKERSANVDDASWSIFCVCCPGSSRAQLSSVKP